MATTYKSGDIVGTRNTRYRVGDGIIPGLGHWVDETYVWRLRYLSDVNLWVLTIKSSLPTAWDGKERLQSATDINQYTLDPEFLASDFVQKKILADNAALENVHLQQSMALSDSQVQDNTTTLTVTNSTKPKDPDPKPRVNTTYLLILAALVLLILVVKRRSS
ncbi:hypothetical protein [Spirosoma endbachense]|uniref:Uncharacterized protein n=1 Tax=Spirosoma endbachense TaxID=2666025 RepID=A0A6P1VPH5_9BACT|nr:hypothetical protein [Spirosoma endbachense]QHV94012.1 hypothetical protein GJR95_02765 [Spirosoma endbachense]